MPRPQTKKDLINASQENYEKLLTMIADMSEKELSTPFDFSDNPKLKGAHWKRDKNVRDILVHLHEWHQLLINWITTNQKGERTDFLPAPYTFKDIAPMNVGFWEKHQKTSYDKALKMFKKSHKDVMKLIDSFSDKELFTKKHFPWTGTTSVGSYCVSSTSSHYDWAMQKIKKHKKNVK